MILGMSHLALTVTDIREEKQKLKNNGFDCTFIEYNVINHPAKKNLLKHYQPTHEIALFRPSSLNVSIEIINHGYVNRDSEGAYQLKTDYIELYTQVLSQEKLFWVESLGFQEKEGNVLNFSSTIPSWSCKMKLVEDAKMQPATLDSSGYPCLALFTNNLEQDIANVQKNGAYDLTETFELGVNNRTLSIAMFRTPGSAICELIQPKR